MTCSIPIPHTHTKIINVSHIPMVNNRHKYHTYCILTNKSWHVCERLSVNVTSKAVIRVFLILFRDSLHLCGLNVLSEFKKSLLRVTKKWNGVMTVSVGYPGILNVSMLHVHVHLEY